MNTRLLLNWFYILFAGMGFGQLPVVLETDPDADGWHERSIDHDGLTRWYLIYRPTDVPENAPVVFLLHGGGGSMLNNFRDNGGASRHWPILAEREKVILVAPNGTDTENGIDIDTKGDTQFWNDLRVGDQASSDQDDVGFLRKLVDEVIEGETADPLRVYFTGLSNGGLMTYRVVMEMAGRVAGAASFVADMPVDNANFMPLQRRVPIFLSWGEEDPLMPYGGEPGIFRSAVDSVAWWVGQNGALSGSPVSSVLPDLNPNDGCRVNQTEYEAGPNGAPVVFWSVEGAGHTMPTVQHFGLAPPFFERIVGKQCGDVESVEEVWSFWEDKIVPLEPELSVDLIEQTQSGKRLLLSFDGGYPGGKVMVQSSTELSGETSWSDEFEASLGDTGNMGQSEIVVSDDKLFLRAVSLPLGR